MNQNFICNKNYIEEKIQNSMCVSFLEIIDQSQNHSGHYPVSKNNISHLKIRIKSDELDPKNKIKAHQKVYSIFDKEIRSGAIHAIQIEIL